MQARGDRLVQFVVKISKLCNLRCRYCYELPELGNREVMSRESLRRMYAHIRGYYEARDRADGMRTELRFIWHGGEPLLVDPQVYWDTFGDQREILGPALPSSNLMQTNLTVLDEERLRLLRDGLDGFGVSVDLFGGLRVNLADRDAEPRVLANMDELRRRGIPFGCITVLTRRNLPFVRQIFRFYERAGLAFRVLPLFSGAFDDQHAGYEVTSEQIVEAYRTLIDLWLQSDQPPSITPVDSWIDGVTHHLTPGAVPRYFSKREWNPALLVNTNGDCYSSGDPYGDPEWTLGNLFTTPLAEIMTGDRMEKSLLEAERRMAVSCTRCPYFMSCTGYPLVEEFSNCREESLGIRVCVVERAAHEHIELRLRAAPQLYAKGEASCGKEASSGFSSASG